MTLEFIEIIETEDGKNWFRLPNSNEGWDLALAILRSKKYKFGPVHSENFINVLATVSGCVKVVWRLFNKKRHDNKGDTL